MVFKQLSCRLGLTGRMFLILGGALKHFLFFTVCFWNFAVHGIWEHLVAWKMVLWNLAVICSQFCGFLKNQSKSRSANNSRKCLDLDPISRKHVFWPARAPPRLGFRSWEPFKADSVFQAPYLGCWILGAIWYYLLLFVVISCYLMLFVTIS